MNHVNHKMKKAGKRADGKGKAKLSPILVRKKNRAKIAAMRAGY